MGRKKGIKALFQQGKLESSMHKYTQALCIYIQDSQSQQQLSQEVKVSKCLEFADLAFPFFFSKPKQGNT